MLEISDPRREEHNRFHRHIALFPRRLSRWRLIGGEKMGLWNDSKDGGRESERSEDPIHWRSPSEPGWVKPGMLLDPPLDAQACPKFRGKRISHLTFVESHLTVISVMTEI